MPDRDPKIPSSEKAALVRAHFETLAPRYDRMNTLLSLGIHHLWKRRAIGLLKLRPGERVLDLCGGTGDLALLAARRIGPTGRVVLYDINRAMMRAGMEKAAVEKAAPISYVQGDAEQMALGTGLFDAAVVGFGIRNLTDMEKGFAEMHRVLKPGGRMICLEFSQPTSSLFRRLYDAYSLRVIPLLGEVLAGSRQAYTYLPESIRAFPSPEDLGDLLGSAGFLQVDYLRLTNGIAVIHRGLKAGCGPKNH